MAKKRKLESKPEPEQTPAPEPEPPQQPEPLEVEEPTPFDVDEEEQEQENLEEEDEEEEEEEEEEEGDGDEPENDGNAPNSYTSPVATGTAAAAAAAGTAVQSSAHTDDDNGDSEEESVDKLLEPLNKEQLIDLLREAASNHPDILNRIRKLADVDPVHRKIFVHGLSWDTNAETLINVFKKYGEIEDCNAVIDKISGKSKGYGFILFQHRSGARKALIEPQKKIGNRMTACQLASSGPVAPPAPVAPPVSEYTQRKIYVSNVSADIDPQKLFSFFAKYGEIEEGPLGLDKQTGKPKGFALFVYRSVESSKKALEEPHKNFEGHILHCQKAIDGPKLNKPYAHHHHPHHGGHGSQFGRSENPSFMGGTVTHAAAAPGGGHMMAQSPVGAFNQGATQALNPALGQALTALLATQGAGLGLTNLLGTLGTAGIGAPVNQAVPPLVNNTGHGMQGGGYGNQTMGSNISPGMMGGYGNQSGMQGGYPNSQMGQVNTGRSQGVGHMGGVGPYVGH